MTTVTVHIENVGCRRFIGAECGLAAMRCAEEQIRLRDADSPDKPVDMEQKLWDAIQGEAGRAVFEAITQQRSASTNDLCEITGFSRPTVSRVLCAYEKLGNVRCLGQANGKAPKVWEIVE